MSSVVHRWTAFQTDQLRLYPLICWEYTEKRAFRHSGDNVSSAVQRTAFQTDQLRLCPLICWEYTEKQPFRQPGEAVSSAVHRRTAFQTGHIGLPDGAPRNGQLNRTVPNNRDLGITPAQQNCTNWSIFIDNPSWKRPNWRKKERKKPQMRSNETNRCRFGNKAQLRLTGGSEHPLMQT